MVTFPGTDAYNSQAPHDDAAFTQTSDSHAMPTPATDHNPSPDDDNATAATMATFLPGAGTDIATAMPDFAGGDGDDDTNPLHAADGRQPAPTTPPPVAKHVDDRRDRRRHGDSPYG